MSVTSTLEPPPGVSYADFVRGWNDEQIALWLSSLGCAHQASTFGENDIRGNVILDLDQHALKEMEITSVGDRIKILNAIKSLRQQCSKGAGPTPRVLLNGGSTSRATSQYEITNGVQRSSSFRHTNGSDGNRDDSITAARRSSGGRRLDGGRPPPLNITQSATRDLPQLSANIATSPGPSIGATTPRPTTQSQSYGQGSQGTGARDQGRPLVDSPSTTPISTVSLPKYTPPTRNYGASLPVGQDRRTPTQADGFTPSSQSFPPPPYTNDPLPPAPGSSGQGSSNGSPPNATNGGRWQGDYGLPSGPKVNNLAVNAHETPGEAAARRAGSPLPPAPVRSSSAKTPIPTVDRTQAGHAKSGSVGLIGQGGTPGKSSTAQPTPGRPSTSGSISQQPSLHPYVTAAPVATSSGAPSVPFPTISNNNLRVEPGVRGRDLSPISESHSILETTPTGPSFAIGSGPNTGNSNATFGAKRSPLPPKNQNDLLRSLIKIHLYDSGQPTTAVNSSVVNVSSCHSGAEIIERALKKFNKQNTRKTSLDADDDRTGETENGGLIVDGWGLFPGGPQNEPTGGPLSETEILSICHADPKHPTREQGLTLRNVRRGQTQKLVNFFGEAPPGAGGQMSPTSPTYTIGPKLHMPEEEGPQLTPSSLKFPTTGTPVTSSRRMDRASTISIMSGLGVDPPPSPGGTPATRSPSNNSFLSGGHKKLRNFFGQRPPSELITSHLPEFFPSTSKKVLQRTARNSMLRTGSKRDSHLSVMGAGAYGRMSFQAPPKSRFSTSSGGSYNNRKSSSPPRSSMSSGPSINDNVSTVAIKEDQDNVPPRMSISTDDGRSVDVSTDDGATTDDTESTKKSLDHTLPPLPTLGDSLSDSLTTGLSGTWLRAESNAAAKRMSLMSTRGRDKSDTASLLTVDEITAEVESRRQSRYSMYEDDEEDEDGNVVVRRPNSKRVSMISSMQGDGDEGEDEEEYDEEEEDYDDEDEEDEEDEDEEDEEGEEEEEGAEDTGNAGRTLLSSGGKRSIKWIKGALIGSGSFGSVYLGMDAVHGLLMAVKQVELPTGSSQNEERKKSMLTALEREIELLKQLQHENIVQYLDSSIDTHHLNIFLEYVPGGSVATLLRNYGAFEEALARNWVRQILQGLNYLHEREIIHRDIKGGNILVDNKGGIKISDFGISKKVEDNLLGAEDFLNKTFELDYTIRPTAAELLSHPWVQVGGEASEASAATPVEPSLAITVTSS
ncbi:ATP binding [Ceratobasidium sp. 423]|nr:ATP binding [Ceratobasidium sp. 423]